MLTYGLFVGVDLERLLLRAVGGMFAGLALGAATGWLGLAVMRDNLNLPEDSASNQAEPGIDSEDGALSPAAERVV